MEYIDEFPDDHNADSDKKVSISCNQENDTISRQAAIDAIEARTFAELIAIYPAPELCAYEEYKGKPYYSIKYIENGEKYVGYSTYNLKVLSQYLKKYFMPPAQPEIIRCKDCIYYDPPHVENNGVRYEYTEMPADAFDVLGTGLVTTEYGINIGGRCCRDYNAGYEDDKRVYVPENNHCGRGERRTDG